MGMELKLELKTIVILAEKCEDLGGKMRVNYQIKLIKKNRKVQR